MSTRELSSNTSDTEYDTYQTSTRTYSTRIAQCSTMNVFYVSHCEVARSRVQQLFLVGFLLASQRHLLLSSLDYVAGKLCRLELDQLKTANSPLYSESLSHCNLDLRTYFISYHVMCMISHVFCAADRGKAIFIGATKEHTGKTSVSMALIAGLVRRYGCIRTMYTVTLLSPSLARRCRFYNDDIITATSAVLVVLTSSTSIVFYRCCCCNVACLFLLVLQQYLLYDTCLPFLVPHGKIP